MSHVMNIFNSTVWQSYDIVPLHYRIIMHVILPILRYLIIISFNKRYRTRSPINLRNSVNHYK